MTEAEKKVCEYIINDGGCDTCSKCIHLNKESCCLYNPESGLPDGDNDIDIDTCISGMVAYFEQTVKSDKNTRIEELEHQLDITQARLVDSQETIAEMERYYGRKK